MIYLLKIKNNDYYYNIYFCIKIYTNLNNK